MPRYSAGDRAPQPTWPASWDSPAARAAAFLAAAVLWPLASLNRSLWQDEFHSLYHASAPSVRALLESVRGDNHPPLSFLLQRTSLACFGENAFALRFPSLLAGLALLAVFARTSRRLADPAARGIAPWLAVSSSYVLCHVAMARMYAPLALATLGLVESVLTAMDEDRGRWRIAAWTALGLHSHYVFFHCLGLLALAGVALWVGWPAKRSALARCLPPALVGGALFLPWCAYAFLHQLGTGALPTASYRGVLVWLESYAHLLFFNAHAGGPLVEYALALPGALVGACFGLLGTVRLVRTLRQGRAPALLLALLALGVAGPSWMYLACLVHPRSGFHLKYLAGFAAPALLIVAVGAGSAARRVPSVFLLAAMLAASVANAVTGGRPDVRGAVDHILAHARPEDAVLVRPYWFRDPERSPTDYGWYARRRRGARAGPVEIPVGRAEEALRHPRVWLIWAGGYPPHALELLDEHFQHLERFPYTLDAVVHVYSRPRENGG